MAILSTASMLGGFDRGPTPRTLRKFLAEDLSKDQMSFNMQDKLLQVLSAQAPSNVKSQRRHNRPNQHASRRRQGTTWR